MDDEWLVEKSKVVFYICREHIQSNFFFFLTPNSTLSEALTRPRKQPYIPSSTIQMTCSPMTNLHKSVIIFHNKVYQVEEIHFGVTSS